MHIAVDNCTIFNICIIFIENDQMHNVAVHICGTYFIEKGPIKIIIK